ncbi:archaetidylserine decarboxylase [Alkalicoccus chagannorensis]|uniref:archaetidylserine decarboxylase n=1 Tax=Alkalicoccus chagannorensis TaxID=427072 RepID=UPI0004298DAA|nr:archaetidylserine decarboxylase [Alkalicoccus chagannorensis]
MEKKTFETLLQLTENPFYNRLLQRLTEHPFSRMLIPPFMKLYNMDEGELEKRPLSYGSLQKFFQRSLKEGARPVSMLERAVVSPVDGVLTAAGALTDNTTFEVKGRRHTLEKLIRLPEMIEKYQGGSYGVIYLAPNDYHHIHTPLSGEVSRRWALGEYSGPVNDLAFQHREEPLSENYRLITELKTAGGCVLVIKIGAVHVNSVRYHHTRAYLTKGERLASFGFGSTVVLVFEQDMMKWTQEEGAYLKQGEAAGIRRSSRTAASGQR